MPSRARRFFEQPDPPPRGNDVTGDILGGSASDPPAALSVGQLLGRIKHALADAFPQQVCVVGEISNLKRPSSGHMYFSLKDAECCIDCVMFRQHTGRMRFRPADGLEVVAEGRVDIYDVRGQLQLYVQRISPRGEGALELALRQLREKLAAEGLFEPGHKKPIPRYPRAVGVVTSPTGAAIRDISRTLRRRWPATEIFLVPVPVQGAAASERIAAAIAALDASAGALGIDTILTGRGGGSLEDLWAFNEEGVARAIFAARTPIIAGVGHETDTALAEMVADLRAPTPTGAAELAVPDAGELSRTLTGQFERLTRRLSERLEAARRQLDGVERTAVFRDPAGRLRTQTQRLDELSHRLRAALRDCMDERRSRLEPLARRLAAMHPARLAERSRARLDKAPGALAWALGARAKRAAERLAGLEGRLLRFPPQHRLELAHQRLGSLARQLEAMSYRRVLRRGFSVTRTADGRIARSAGELTPGAAMETELADGRVRSRVEGQASPTPPKPAKKRPTPPSQTNPDELQPGLFD